MLAIVSHRPSAFLVKVSTRFAQRLSAVSALTIVLLVSGCSDGIAIVSLGGRDTGGGLTPPTALLQSRAIDRTQLRPIVTIIDGPGTDPCPDTGTGTDIPMERLEGTDRWQGSRDVPSGRDYCVRVVWVELVEDGNRMRDLNLATLVDRITVDLEEGGDFEAEAREYDYSADDDQDGVNNFDERQNGSYPFPSNETEPTEIDDPTNVSGPAQPTEAPTTDAPDVDAPDLGPTDVDPPDIDVPQAQADVLIPRIATDDAPRIDGRDVDRDANGAWQGDWALATHLDARGNPLLINRLMIDQGSDESNGTARRFWAAAHDGEYLYLAVIVDDDGARQRDSFEVWNDDSLELYLDGDNSKSTTYDDNDYLRLLPLTEPGSTDKGVDDGIVNGFFSSQNDLDLDFATGPGRGPDGIRDPRTEQDIYELRISLASAGIVPGRPFGFELQINDDDDGDEREAKWGWAHPARVGEDVDFTFRDPSFMGTALLE